MYGDTFTTARVFEACACASSYYHVLCDTFTTVTHSPKHVFVCRHAPYHHTTACTVSTCV